MQSKRLLRYFIRMSWHCRDAWISFRPNEFGNDEELAIQLYTMLTAKSWRVFYAPICLPGTFGIAAASQMYLHIFPVPTSCHHLPVRAQKRRRTMSRSGKKSTSTPAQTQRSPSQSFRETPSRGVILIFQSMYGRRTQTISSWSGI